MPTDEPRIEPPPDGGSLLKKMVRRLSIFSQNDSQATSNKQIVNQSSDKSAPTKETTVKTEDVLKPAAGGSTFRTMARRMTAFSRASDPPVVDTVQPAKQQLAESAKENNAMGKVAKQFSAISRRMSVGLSFAASDAKTQNPTPPASAGRRSIAPSRVNSILVSQPRPSEDDEGDIIDLDTIPMLHQHTSGPIADKLKHMSSQRLSMSKSRPSSLGPIIENPYDDIRLSSAILSRSNSSGDEDGSVSSNDSEKFVYFKSSSGVVVSKQRLSKRMSKLSKRISLRRDEGLEDKIKIAKQARDIICRFCSASVKRHIMRIRLQIKYKKMSFLLIYRFLSRMRHRRVVTNIAFWRLVIPLVLYIRKWRLTKRNRVRHAALVLNRTFANYITRRKIRCHIATMTIRRFCGAYALRRKVKKRIAIMRMIRYAKLFIAKLRHKKLLKVSTSILMVVVVVNRFRSHLDYFRNLRTRIKVSTSCHIVLSFILKLKLKVRRRKVAETAIILWFKNLMEKRHRNRLLNLLMKRIAPAAAAGDIAEFRNAFNDYRMGIDSKEGLMNSTNSTTVPQNDTDSLNESLVTLKFRDYEWSTLLLIASSDGHMAIVHELIALGASKYAANDVDYFQRTALHKAVMSGDSNIALVSYLTKNYPQLLGKRDNFNFLPVDLAIECQYQCPQRSYVKVLRILQSLSHCDEGVDSPPDLAKTSILNAESTIQVNSALTKAELASKYAELANRESSFDAQYFANRTVQNYKLSKLQPFVYDDQEQYVPSASYLGFDFMKKSQLHTKLESMDLRPQVPLQPLQLSVPVEAKATDDSDMDDNDVCTKESPGNSSFPSSGGAIPEVIDLVVILKILNYRNFNGVSYRFTAEELLEVDDMYVIEKLRKVPLYRVDEPILRKAVRRAIYKHKLCQVQRNHSP